MSKTFKSGGLTFKDKSSDKIIFYEISMPETIIHERDIAIVTHEAEPEEIDFEIDSVPSFFTSKKRALKARREIIDSLESKVFFRPRNAVPIFLYLSLLLQSFAMFKHLDRSNKREKSLKEKIIKQNIYIKDLENNLNGMVNYNESGE